MQLLSFSIVEIYSSSQGFTSWQDDRAETHTRLILEELTPCNVAAGF